MFILALKHMRETNVQIENPFLFTNKDKPSVFVKEIINSSKKYIEVKKFY